MTDAATDLAMRIAEAVSTHPAVVRLDGGTFGAVATYLPGSRLLGVSVPEGDGPVQVAVVLRLGPPIPVVVAELRTRVAALVGGRPVDVTVSDVLVAAGP